MAFYGFRGGAGRTTALAYVAAFMASREENVVAVDLDVEAPGLHHVLDCPDLEDGRGTVALLREAAVSDEALHVAPHVVKSALRGGAPIRVVPAGRLSETYLESLDDLGVGLWHVVDESSPLQMLLEQIKVEFHPRSIFLDCRTGFDGLSATAIFHASDMVVCFLPVSKQSLDGFDVFLKGIKAAKTMRAGLPDILIVPSMVPEGPDSRERLRDWFIPEIERRYAEIVLGAPLGDPDETDTGALSDSVPLLREGIEYRRGIALADDLRENYAQLAGGVYRPLLNAISQAIHIQETPRTPISVNAAQILEELVSKGDLKNLAFAESMEPEEIVKRFIQPSAFKTAVDRATWYVVGAKGAGKTWLWTYLQSQVARTLSAEVRYVAAHGPKKELLSSSAFRELETNSKIRMKLRGLHGSLWLFYAAKRIMTAYPDVGSSAMARLSAQERKSLTRLEKATDDTFQREVARLLTLERAATLAEKLLRILDDELLSHDIEALTLLYDGLDVGFGSDKKAVEMRRRYVNGLVGAIEPQRGVTKRIFFKVFLREDIFAELNIQNQSHLEAATVELRWEPRDLWILALNLVSSASRHYLNAVRSIDPSAGPPANWPRDDDGRRRLLDPLWGAQMERGNKTSTAGFLQRRTADGKDRLFPRTLVQLLAASVEHQQKIEPRGDRVLRSAAIQEGFKTASKKRVEDLKKEYAALGVYLDGLSGMTPTGTEKSIADYLKRRMPTKKGSRGVVSGSLHAGTGGWKKVIAQLMEIGVLREYKRARGPKGELKYEIALLYRPGLGIKAYGV
ncbi:MAG: hypothetical protein KAI47_27605 [Deltaproteobacteria bacterium]|nr:hypothetical protein [Deltaproteobacteria bacterium]